MATENVSIARETAKEIFPEFLPGTNAELTYSMMLDSRRKDAEEAILRALEQAEGWVKVSERLPELQPYLPYANCHASDRLMLWHKREEEEIGYFCEKNDGSTWWEINGEDVSIDNVTHYRPLPSPPNSEETANG